MERPMSQDSSSYASPTVIAALFVGVGLGFAAARSSESPVAPPTVPAVLAVAEDEVERAELELTGDEPDLVRSGCGKNENHPHAKGEAPSSADQCANSGIARELDELVKHMSEEEFAQRAALARGDLAGKRGTLRVGQAALRARFPSFPDARTEIIPMGDQMIANGVPMNLAFFETEKDAPTVLEFYARHFDDRGWSRLGLRDTVAVTGKPAISATDMEEQLQLSVLVLENPDRTGSTVILSVADMLPESAPPTLLETADLPIYPGVKPMSVRAQDREVQSLTVNFTTTDPSRNVEHFYREQLKAMGYSEQETPELATGDGSPRMLRFASAERAWNLTISQTEGNTAVTALTSTAEATP
jgi:hypothetical protein